MGVHYADLAILQATTGILEEALTSFETALSIRKRLAGENPKVIRYQEFLADGFTELGNLQRDTGKRDEAFSSFKTATDLLKKLVNEDRESILPALTRGGNVELFPVLCHRPAGQFITGFSEFYDKGVIAQRMILVFIVDDFF